MVVVEAELVRECGFVEGDGGGEGFLLGAEVEVVAELALRGVIVILPHA